jgi:hypothetical protein
MNFKQMIFYIFFVFVMMLCYSSYLTRCIFLVQVTLVGMVYEKVERNTDVNFVLDDGTGRIKCRRWYFLQAKCYVDYL